MKINNYEVDVKKDSYVDNKSLAVYLETKKKELYAVLTVNIHDSDFCDKDCQFVDVNNCPWAPKFLQDNDLAHPTGRFGDSGFCVYPEYKFNLEKF